MVGALLVALAAQGAAAPIVQPSINWSECVLAHVHERLGSGTAAAVADYALGACRRQEEAVRRAFVIEAGPARARADMPIARAQIRARAIDTIDQLRGVAPPRQDASTDFGYCVAEQAEALSALAQPAEQVADMVLVQCAAQEAAMRAEAVQRYGAAIEQRSRVALHDNARASALRQIMQARARH